MNELISWDHFTKIDIRVGTVIAADLFAEAKKPACKLIIDFGESVGHKRSSAQITNYYTPEALLGQQVVAIINFPQKQIANFFSECLVLGVYDEEGEVVLLQPQQVVKNGASVG